MVLRPGKKKGEEEKHAVEIECRQLYCLANPEPGETGKAEESISEGRNRKHRSSGKDLPIREKEGYNKVPNIPVTHHCSAALLDRSKPRSWGRGEPLFSTKGENKKKGKKRRLSLGWPFLGCVFSGKTGFKGGGCAFKGKEKGRKGDRRRRPGRLRGKGRNQLQEALRAQPKFFNTHLIFTPM